MSVDVPGRLHTIKTAWTHVDMAGCWRPLSWFIDWAGDMTLRHRCCCGAQWTLGGGQMVAGGGGCGSSGDAVEVGGRCGWWWVEKETCSHLFVHNAHVSFWQTPLTRLSIKRAQLLTCTMK